MPARGFESVQVVAFFTGTPGFSNAADLWSQHMGEPYTAFNKVNQVLTTASGLVDGLAYEIQLHVNRVGIVVRPGPAQMGPPPVLNDLDALVQPALARMLPILSGLNVVRQALIATIHEEVADSPSAVARLLELVPNLPVVSDAQDVSFQLSRRKQSNIQPDVRINRLCRWSGVIGVEMVFQIGDNSTPLPGREHHLVESFYDVNTHVDDRVRPEHVSALFDELVEEVRALDAQGANAIA